VVLDASELVESEFESVVTPSVAVVEASEVAVPPVVDVLELAVSVCPPELPPEVDGGTLRQPTASEPTNPTPHRQCRRSTPIIVPRLPVSSLLFELLD
jgi:hypothetical protein